MFTVTLKDENDREVYTLNNISQEMLRYMVKTQRFVSKMNKSYNFMTIESDKDIYQLTFSPRGKYFKNIVYGYTIM